MDLKNGILRLSYVYTRCGIRRAACLADILVAAIMRASVFDFGTRPHGLSVDFLLVFRSLTARRISYLLASCFLAAFSGCAIAATYTMPDGQVVDVAGQFSPYDNAEVRSLYNSAGMSYTYSNPPTATNPQGYKANVVGGAAVLESPVHIQAVAPAGASVNSATSAAAIAAAGGAGAAATAATLLKSAPLASATAATLGKAALGVGVGTAAVLLSPAIAATLTAASIGMLGYQFYQAIQGQGVTLNPDGSAIKTTVGGVESVAPTTPASWYTVYASYYFHRPSVVAACQALVDYRAAAVPSSPYTMGVPTYYAPWNSWNCNALSFAGAPVNFYASVETAAVCPVASPSYTFNNLNGQCERAGNTSAPATNDQLIAAINAATLMAAVAADTANFAISRGVPLPPEATATATTPALSLASEFAEVKQSVDSLGNITKTLERNLLNFAPSVAGQPPVIDTRRETVQLVNSVPQSVSSTSLAPNIGTAVANAAKQKTDDLCATHPDILACADLSKENDVPDTAFLQKDVSVSLTPVNVPKNATCPAPVSIDGVLGRHTVSFDVVCQNIAFLKPLLLAFAWLTAGMIVFVGRPYST